MNIQGDIRSPTVDGTVTMGERTPVSTVLTPTPKSTGRHTAHDVVVIGGGIVGSRQRTIWPSSG